MSISNEPAASRRFVAHPPFWGSKFASITTPAWQKNPARSYLIMVVAILAFTAVIGGLYMGAQMFIFRSSGGSRALADMSDKLIRYGFVALLFGAMGAWYWWSQRSGHGNVVIDATTAGLTVSKRPGDVYPFRDAKLGVWGVSGGMTMGTALHLQCGPRRFILGGRDFRVAAGTRLEAPDAGYGMPVDVDAWVTATEFGEILSMAGRQSSQAGLAARPPAPGEPIRCLLFPSALGIQQMGPFAMRRKQELLRSANRPRLAIDVEPDAIRVVDMNTNALVVAAQISQVTAIPETYQYRHGFGLSWEQSMASSMSTTPVLVICVPGMQALSVGCRDSTTGLDRRFSWPGNERQRVNEPPDFSVSGADWLTLVEKFGLSQHLQRRDQRA